MTSQWEVILQHTGLCDGAMRGLYYNMVLYDSQIRGKSMVFNDGGTTRSIDQLESVQKRSGVYFLSLFFEFPVFITVNGATGKEGGCDWPIQKPGEVTWRAVIGWAGARGSTNIKDLAVSPQNSQRIFTNSYHLILKFLLRRFVPLIWIIKYFITVSAWNSFSNFYKTPLQLAFKFAIK